MSQEILSPASQKTIDGELLAARYYGLTRGLAARFADYLGAEDALSAALLGLAKGIDTVRAKGFMEPATQKAVIGRNVYRQLIEGVRQENSFRLVPQRKKGFAPRPLSLDSGLSCTFESRICRRLDCERFTVALVEVLTPRMRSVLPAFEYEEQDVARDLGISKKTVAEFKRRIRVKAHHIRHLI